MSGVNNDEDPFTPVKRIWERAGLAREESDTAYAYDLLIVGEFILKLSTLAVISAILDIRERHRYRLEYTLIRADGIGDWVDVLYDALDGPASQYLLVEAREEQRDFTKRLKLASDAWQYHAVTQLDEACAAAQLNLDPLPTKVSMRHWFDRFVTLRNRTRGHGALTPAGSSALCPRLEASLWQVSMNLAIFKRPWAYLHRNLSGKYRLVELGSTTDEWDHLKRERHHSHENGIHIWFGEPCPVRLLATDTSLSDFYIANGNFNGTTYEGLSYISDTTCRMDGAAYRIPPDSLPPSQTDARLNLDLRGRAFTDMPPAPQEYVTRQGLEEEVHRVLADSARFPLVTLHGRGGIGKTSLALKVLHEVTEGGNFFCILWFSARDIDLLQQGPQTVEPQALTKEEIASQFVDKMDPKERNTEGFNKVTYFSRMLAAQNEEMPLLFVFDNFETVRNPAELYEWIANTIRLPNKALITTRFREFKADYPVEVGGMTEQEFAQLVKQTAARLGMYGQLDDSYIDELYDECGGHPYLAKVYLGEAAVSGRQPDVRRVLASREEILEALFERSFGMLAPHAQRVFLTLCNWRSHVPRLALEAAVLRTRNERMDVQDAIDRLERSSLIDVVISEEDGQEWLSVPLAANIFGRKKLAVSPMKSAIEADTKILQVFGAARGTDVQHGIEPAVRRMVRRVAEKVHSNEDVRDFSEVLEYIAASYPRAWLDIAELSGELGESVGFPDPTTAIGRYLEAVPSSTEGWRRLANRYQMEEEWLAEMNALLQLSSQRNVAYEEISNVANRFNYLLAEKYLDVDSDEKRIIAERLRDLMVSRLAEANSTDISRAAWLSLHLGDEEKARSLVGRGLQNEPQNIHCVKLWRKLERQ